MIRSAVILAAGRGKRQRPFTDKTPKPLLAVRGRATLDYLLIAVHRAGVEQVCIVTHHLEDQIFDFVGDGSRWGLGVTFAHQPEQRGSGDALLSVPRLWTGSDSFMVLAADYILEESALVPLVEAHEQLRADITMSLKACSVAELTRRSNAVLDDHWRVKQIIEKPSPDQIASPYAASMLFIFPPDIWHYLPRIQLSVRGEIELQSAVQAMIEDGYRAYGVLQPAPEEWRPGR